ncbi:MAG: hypothetical protein ACQKBY_06945, partial [Verrucomicrobiales bacterium]
MKNRSVTPLHPRLALATLGALFLSSCQQEDPAIVNELVVMTAENERLKGELEKARESAQELQQQLQSAKSQAEQAVQEAQKGLDKKMVQRSFVEAVTELQEQIEKKYPSDQVVSYKIFDVTFPSDTPISSSVAFTMKDQSGAERLLSFDGAANVEGVWNFAQVENIVERTPKVKAPEAKPPAEEKTAQNDPAPTPANPGQAAGGIQRLP